MEVAEYSDDVRIQSWDADFRRLMKASALLHYSEQVAADHARIFGMDDKFFDEHNVAMLLGRQALKFYRVPTRAEVLTARSSTERIKRGSIKRITSFYDNAGEKVAVVDSRWVIVDRTEGHILREAPWEVQGYWNDNIEEEVPQLVHKVKDLISAGERKVHYSLTDINGHLNNAYYVDIACDALPIDELKKAPVTFASVKYNRQVLFGESMEILYAQSGNGWYVVGRKEGKSTFECYLELGQPQEV